MRSPTDNAADETKAAVEAALDELRGPPFLGLRLRLLIAARRRASAPPDPDPDEPRQIDRSGWSELRSETYNRVALSMELSEESRSYVCWLIEQDNPPRGRGQPGDAERDGLIRQAVAHFIKRGFHPTRNETTQRKEKLGEPAGQSACSIVQKALARFGLNLSERTIEDIWATRKVRE